MKGEYMNKFNDSDGWEIPPIFDTMTADEVIVRLRCLRELTLDLFKVLYSERYKDALKIALDAVNKQIPAPPKKRENQCIYECPVCGVEAHDNYCRYCGQKLDWR